MLGIGEKPKHHSFKHAVMLYKLCPDGQKGEEIDGVHYDTTIVDKKDSLELLNKGWYNYPWEALEAKQEKKASTTTKKPDYSK